MTGVPALHVEGLGKRYGQTWALRDCTLTIPVGATVAVVGPNGAGKTTLLEAVAGLVRPTEGTIRVLGETARPGSSEALAQVGFVGQQQPLYKGFTVRELLKMGRALNREWDQLLAEGWLAELGIPLDRKAGRLSGGQRAQVALALALAKRSPLLVLDEPTASLDPLVRRQFMGEVMAAVAEDEITVLMSSHVVSELGRLCDWLVVLAHGRLQVAGPIDELIDEHRLFTGPRAGVAAAGDADGIPGVVNVEHGDRYTRALVRVGPGPEPHPRWQSQPVGLDDLVLAYLAAPAPTYGTAPACSG
ncbi:ABC transporter ATP-binding protein [Yinghuangia seranimata]|uniref:ABC transporter ATP-binding protein n=1 Tax=Yinghuangia seranimata TaxID=408067 RepID=UPI00248BC794|nr:ABC transporter ATP-binding protein [Yinghuangia seranimata]MDI2130688.1 ABC transporter ATP-binding protein [Yinghuangia seranimata]